MQYKKAQMTIYLLIAIVMIISIIIVMQVTNQEATTLKVIEKEKLSPLKDFVDQCYIYQQKCLLKKAGIVRYLGSIDYYKDYFKHYIIDNSRQCTRDAPIEISKDFVGETKVKDVASILPRDKSIFVLETNQRVVQDADTTKEFGNYMQEHEVGFSALHTHAQEINKNEKINFDYLASIPINQKIYRAGDAKHYIMNDTFSELDHQQYLFLFIP